MQSNVPSGAACSVEADSGYGAKPEHLVPKNNSVSTGGRSGPPLRRAFVNEHVVKSHIQNQKEICQAREGAAALPYAEDLRSNTSLSPISKAK